VVIKTLEGKREKDKYEEEKRERVSFFFKEREAERWVKRDIKREKRELSIRIKAEKVF